MEEKVLKVIDELRPFLMNDGGNIELVKIEHDHAEENCVDKEWISGLEGLLKDAKPTHRQSVNDSPYADGYYAVTLESETMENGPFYVYEDGKKTYIEFPYEGIYLADDRMIDHLAVMFPDHLFPNDRPNEMR